MPMRRRLKIARRSFAAVVIGAAVAYFGYLFALNSLGPSTRYYNPQLGNATKIDGKDYVYLGDEFYVWISIVRHKRNGNCQFHIKRYAEEVGGPRDGERHLISRATLQFVGQDELRRTRWPIPADPYYLGYAVDKNGQPIVDKPLLPDGVDEQEYTFYVVGRYYCNALDYVFPRYIQGGDRPNITPRINAIVRRHKP